MLDLAIEQTKRSQNHCIENQPITFPDEYTNCQNLKRTNIYDKQNSHRPFADARPNAIEVGRD